MKSVDRTDLDNMIDEYANQCVEDMDMDTLCESMRDSIAESMSELTTEQVISIIGEYYPELLEKY